MTFLKYAAPKNHKQSGKSQMYLLNPNNSKLFNGFIE
jgi:hypothetical protein